MLCTFEACYKRKKGNFFDQNVSLGTINQTTFDKTS